MDQPRKGKRKADDSEKRKSKKFVLVDEPEAKKRKKQPVSEVQSAKDLPGKTIQSKKLTKRSVEDVEALPENIRSSKEKKVKKRISKQSSSSSESSDNEDQPIKRANNSKNVENSIKISSDSESTSGNEQEKSRSSRKEKMNKHLLKKKSNSKSTSGDEEEARLGKKKSIKKLEEPIHIQSIDIESSSDDEKNLQSVRKEKITRDPIFLKRKNYGESDSKSTSDNEEEAQLGKKKNIKKFKEPVHILNSSDSESTSDNEEKSQSFRKLKINKDLLEKKSDSESTSDDGEEAQLGKSSGKRKNIKKYKEPIHIQHSSDSESTSDDEKKSQSFRNEKINKDLLKKKSNSQSISDSEEEAQSSKKKNIEKFKEPAHILNSSDSESTSDSEEEAQLSKKKNIKKFKEPIHIQNSSDSESTSDDERKSRSFRKEKINKDLLKKKSNSQSISDNEEEAQLSKKKNIKKFKEPVHILNSSDSESTSDKEEKSRSFRKEKINKDLLKKKRDKESTSDDEAEAQLGKKKNIKKFKEPVHIQNSSDSESTSDNEKKPRSFRKEKNGKNPILLRKRRESTSNKAEEKMIEELDSIYIHNSSDSESISDDEEEAQLTKEKIIEEFKEPIDIQNSSDSESFSDGEEEAPRLRKKKIIEQINETIHRRNGRNSIGRKSMSNNKEQEILKDENCKARIIENDSDIMSKEEQLILIERIKQFIPDKDYRSYHFRLRQLDWHKIAFKDYTIDQCKQVWSQLFKKVRHYRLLQEITGDIQEILKFNDLQAINRNPIQKQTRKHPALPSRPMSAYLIYYTKNCDKLAKKRPDLQGISFDKYIVEKYRQLSLEAKEKYDLMAIKMREDYNVKLAQFYNEHPYVKKEKQVYKKNVLVLSEKPPKAPQKAFELFLVSEMKNQIPEDRTEFRKDCRKKWKQMPDLVKLDWINLAEEKTIEYQKKLREYMARHPKFIPKKSSRKTGLTTEEKRLKEKLSGKPKKPPLTPFHLFASTILKTSAETVPPKDRWKYCSVKWKALPQEDRDRYQQACFKKHIEYKEEFGKYLDTLPEDKRQQELVWLSKTRQPFGQPKA